MYIREQARANKSPKIQYFHCPKVGFYGLKITQKFNYGHFCQCSQYKVTTRFSYIFFLIIILAKKLPIIGYSLFYVVPEFHLSTETLVKIPSLNTQFGKKNEKSGFPYL